MAEWGSGDAPADEQLRLPEARPTDSGWGSGDELVPIPTAKPDRPRWDLFGDIGRAAGESADFMKQGLSEAFPSIEAREREHKEKTEKYGLYSPQRFAVDFGDDLSRMGSLGKSVLGAMGVITSPLTGAARASVGSAMSYLPGMDKRKADEAVDLSLMGLRAGGVKTTRPGIAAASPAERAVIKDIEKGVKEGGLTPEEMLAKAAETPDKPLTISDQAGSRMDATTGRLARTEGGRPVTEAWFKTRDKGATNPETGMVEGGAGPRVEVDLNNTMGEGSKFQAVGELMTTQKETSRPLYREALKPGSTAPLQRQFENAFGEAAALRAEAAQELAAAENRMTQAQAQKSRAGNNVYGSNAALQAEREAAAAIEAAQTKLATAEQNQAITRDTMRGAQAAGEKGERGAVWSPRIQQYMDDPITRGGIKKGLEIQRLEALNEGTAFNPRDHGIVGLDQAGEPIIARVPNMRLLDAAKKGLDAKIDSYPRDWSGKPQLDALGRQVAIAVKNLTAEIDRLNPAYGQARAAWAGPARALDAMEFGRTALKNSPEEIAARLADMTPAELQTARLGLKDKLREDVLGTSTGGDEARKLIGSNMLRLKIRPFFESDAEFANLMKNVEAETLMFEKQYGATGNSASMRRAAEDAQGEMASLAGRAMSNIFHRRVGATVGNALSLAKNVFRADQAPMDAAQARLIHSPLNQLPPGVQGPPTQGVNLLQNYRQMTAPGQIQAPNSVLGLRLAPPAVPRPPPNVMAPPGQGPGAP